MIFGYARVSTDDQNLSLQIDALTHYGIDKLFQEKSNWCEKRPTAIRRNDQTYYVKEILLSFTS